jgi:hypothetical protein
MAEPQVGVIMGSASDWEVMQHAVRRLTDFGIPSEARVISAHRSPELAHRYASEAAGRGLVCLIAGAGEGPDRDFDLFFTDPHDPAQACTCRSTCLSDRVSGEILTYSKRVTE